MNPASPSKLPKLGVVLSVEGSEDGPVSLVGLLSCHNSLQSLFVGGGGGLYFELKQAT